MALRSRSRTEQSDRALRAKISAERRQQTRTVRASGPNGCGPSDDSLSISPASGLFNPTSCHDSDLEILSLPPVTYPFSSSISLLYSMPQQLGNSSQSRSTSVPLGKVTRGHSCTLCSQRKVRCDGKRPCSTCIKSSRTSECRSSRPAVLTSLARDGPSSREHALIQRLRHYEGLLTAHGIPITTGRGTGDESKPGTEATSPKPKSDDGHVIMQRGHPRFVDK